VRMRVARVRVITSVALVAAATGLSLVCGGCQNSPHAGNTPDRPPLPSYDEVVARYNARAERLGRLWARAVIRLTYKDESGTPHTDQGEGLLQMIRPDRVALSIKKAGKMLFWFGCDDQRYWFFDVVDAKTARVGTHAKPGEHEHTDSAGIAIPPRDLFELIGLSPLDASARGGTSWSSDGAALVVTLPHAHGGSSILMLDPASLEPRRIEHRSSGQVLIIAADLSDYAGVDVTGFGGARPRLATHIDAIHIDSDTRIRLDLSELRDSGISEKAFVFEELTKALGVDTITDLDRAPQSNGSPPHSSTSPAPSPVGNVRDK